jgi:hypothetical protein
MTQEKFDRFPQSGFPEFGHRLRVFLHGYMQGIFRREDFPRRHETFQFRCGQTVNCDRIFGQAAQDGASYPLRFGFVRKVLLYTLASGIIGELVPYRDSPTDKV